MPASAPLVRAGRSLDASARQSASLISGPGCDGQPLLPMRVVRARCCGRSLALGAGSLVAANRGRSAR
eukprot:4810082-Prymnesium_polylepis.1